MSGYLDDSRISARLAEVERRTTRYSFFGGRAQSDGAGGLTVNEFTGGTVAVVGPNLRCTFATPRPTPIKYRLAGARIGTGNQYLVLLTATSTTADIQVRVDNATTVDLSTQVANFSFDLVDSD